MQEPQEVKGRTKILRDDWVGVRKPNPVPDLEDDWQMVRKPMQQRAISAAGQTDL